MIIRREFEGDDNEILKNVQRRHYGITLRMLVEKAWENYRHAEEVLGIAEDQKLPGLIWCANQECVLFSHLHVEAAHDVFAAVYRRLYKAEESLFSCLETEQILRCDWDDYVFRAVERWMNDPFTVRAFVIATQFADQPEGRCAGRVLNTYLRTKHNLPQMDESAREER
ncbi:MAG: hypothetical protein JNK25_03845 [Phycisphaerae bacterium]|nr:hypothetical protein [Phycisphaerae bacterium]